MEPCARTVNHLIASIPMGIRHGQRFFAAVLVAYLFSFVTARPVVASAADKSEDAIRRQIIKAQEQIQSIEFQYRLHMGNGIFAVRKIKAKAPCLLLHDSGHDGLDYSVKDDEARQVAHVFADHYLNFRPLERTVVRRKLTAKEGLPGSLPGELYFIATGIWPFSGREAPRPFGHAHMLVEVAASSEFTIGKDRQSVGGRQCRLITHQSGRDRLWVDPEKGCCVIQRELYDEDGTTLMTRWSMSDHRQFESDLWIPFSVRRTEFDSRLVKDSVTQPRVMDVIAKLDYALVNRLSDADFQFVAPPGMLELDPDEGNGEPKQVLPGGIDLLDEQANWIERRTHVHKNRQVTKIYMAVLVIGVFSVGAVLCLQVIRYRHDGRTRPQNN